MKALRMRLVHRVRVDRQPIAVVCRELGFSRRCAYKWLKRFDADPHCQFENQSRRPKTSPLRIPDKMRKQIVEEFDQQPASARRIRDRMILAHIGSVPALSSIEAILKQNNRFLFKKTLSESKECHYAMFESLINGQISQSFLKNDITLENLNELFNILKKGSKLQRRQAAALLLLNFGLKKTSTARACQSSTRTIANYQTWFEREGLKSLHWRSTGRAKDQSVKNAVIALLHTPPSSHGLNRTSWTLRDLNRTLRKQGIPVSEKVISEVIRQSGYRWLKAKKVLTSNDPNYSTKLSEIQAVLSNLGPNERFFSIDEMGPISIKKLGGKRLVPPGVIPQYPQYQRSKGRLIITAALELSRNQVTHFYSEKKNTAEMIKLLDILLEHYTACDCLYLSWDAASWHASKDLYKRVEEINASRSFKNQRTPLVKLVPLPSCAQFLNVIESVFSGLARAVIHNSDYQSVTDAQTAIDKYFKERNNHFLMNPKKAGNRIWGRELVTPEFSVCQNCKDPRW